MIRSRIHLLPRLPRVDPLRLLALWRATGRQRHDLRHLDDHLLKDVGLTRDDADHEASRPFWDAPRNWRL